MPRRPRRVRWCASSTTRNGSTARPRRRWRSWRGACSPSGSRWCSPFASPARRMSSQVSPSCSSKGSQTSDARALLASALPGVLDERIRDRIVAETRGNPLALMELPRGLTPAELAGGFGVPDAGPLSGHIEQSFLRRFESLPPDSQQLVLTAAAEPVGDVTLLWRAAERLGIGAEAVAPAEAAELIALGARVRFRHPLVRSAVYRAAAVPERQKVHRALAEATDPEEDPDRRAWHRAHAAAGLDEAVADELERSADRARRRGGVAAAAAFLERAAELTPDPARRGARALAAAQAKLEAGSREAAETLLATAELAPLDELQRGLLQRLRAQIAFVFTRGSDGPPLLARRRQTARSTRSRIGARDLSRGARSGHVRRTRRCRLRCPAGCRGGPSCPRRAGAAAIDRPRSRRPGAPVHGGTRRGRAAAQARAPGGQDRGARRSRGDHALALAVSDRPVDDRVRAVGRRRVPRARHSRGAAGPGYRRARHASRRARLPVGRAPVRRGVRRGRGACRGGGRDRARNRQREPHVRLAARRRLARRRGRSHGVHQRRPRRRECAKRGKGAWRWPATRPPFSTTAWAATRRPWTAPSAPATTATSGTPARRCQSSSKRRLVPASRRSLPPRWPGWKSGRAPRARIGRSASWRAHGR